MTNVVSIERKLTFTWFPSIYSDKPGFEQTVGIDELPEYIHRKINENRGDMKDDLPLFTTSVFKNQRRLGKNVREIHAVVCEHDAGNMTLEEAAELLNKIGIVFVLYGSPSYTEVKPKWRLLLPLREPLIIADGRSLSKVKKQYRLLQGCVNGVLKGNLAPESKDLVRVWFCGYIKGNETPPDIFHTDDWTHKMLDEMPELEAGGISVGENSGIRGGDNTVTRIDDLTLDKIMVLPDGEEVPLKSLLIKLEKKQKIRLSGKTYREDSSGRDSVHLRMTQDGYPMAYDSASGDSHMLVQSERDEVNKMFGRPTSYKIGGTANSGQTTAIIMSKDEMKNNLIQLSGSSEITFKNDTDIVLSPGKMHKILLGNNTPNANGQGFTPTFERWEQDLNRTQVKSLTFSPGTPVFTRNPSGGTAVNTWRPILRSGQTYEEAWGKSKMFWDHIKFLFKDRTNEFIDWLAHIEQYPGELPHTSWLHIAPQEGMGRSTLGNILYRVWRPYVTPDIDLSKLLDSKFNTSIVSKVLCVVGEVKEGGRGQWNHKQKFKTLITEEVREVNTKFIKPYEEFNCLRWLLFSNHENALPLDDTDRRVEVIINRGKPKSGTYYIELNKYKKSAEFIDAIGCVLKMRNLDHFDLSKRALASADKATLIETGKDLTDYLVECVFEYWPYDVITAAALFGILTGEYSPKTTAAAEGNLMKRYTGDMLHLKRAKALLYNHEGFSTRKTTTFYVIRNKERYTNKKYSEIVHDMNRHAEYRANLYYERGEAYDALDKKQKESLYNEFHGWKKKDKKFVHYPADRYFGVKFYDNWGEG